MNINKETFIKNLSIAVEFLDLQSCEKLYKFFLVGAIQHTIFKSEDILSSLKNNSLAEPVLKHLIRENLIKIHKIVCVHCDVENDLRETACEWCGEPIYDDFENLLYVSLANIVQEA